MFPRWYDALSAGASGFLLRHLLTLKIRKATMTPINVIDVLKAIAELVSTGSSSFAVGPIDETVDVPGIGKVTATQTVTVTLKRS